MNFFGFVPVEEDDVPGCGTVGFTFGTVSAEVVVTTGASANGVSGVGTIALDRFRSAAHEVLQSLQSSVVHIGMYLCVFAPTFIFLKGRLQLHL